MKAERKRPPVSGRAETDDDVKTLHASAKSRKPDGAVLFETPRPAGGSLRIVREQAWGRAIVRLVHLSAAGVPVHAFTLEPGELRAVAEVLTAAEVSS